MNLIRAWKSRNQIIEGITNSIFKQSDVEEIAAERLAICKTNTCGYYDPEGKMPDVALPGKESCGACGCHLPWKIRSLSSACGLTKVDKEPLWDAEITTDEESSLIERMAR